MTTARLQKARQQAGPHAIAQPRAVRIFTPVQVVVPLAVGIMVAIAMNVLLETGALASVAEMSAARRFTVIWVLPICAAGLVASLRTLMIDVTAGGVLVRRACGLARLYKPSQIEMWGFRHGPGAWGKLPPADARRPVQFILRTARGWTFRKTITGAVAQQISALMLRQPGAGA